MLVFSVVGQGFMLSTIEKGIGIGINYFSSQIQEAPNITLYCYLLFITKNHKVHSFKTFT